MVDMSNHRIEFLALAMLAGACDGDLAVGLPKSVVKIPLTGGLDTKTGPLAQVPGTFLQLDDVRQERRNEWRNRNGITHSDALDDVPGTVTPQPPLLTAELPGGTGIVGLSQLELVANASDKSAALVYDRTTPSGIARWQRKTPYYDAPMAPPGFWNRQAVAGEALPVSTTTVAVGTTGMRLVAWNLESDGVTTDGIRYMLTTAEGTPLLGPLTISPTTTFLPRAVYISGFFLLFYADASTADVNVIKLSEATASFVTSAVLRTDADTTGIRALDARVYNGATTATVVYRQSAGGLARQLEVNPTTLALTANASLAVNCFNALALLPDPDSSGRRFVAVCTTTPNVQVLATSAAATVVQTDIASTDTVNQIIGSAYEAGNGWLIVGRLNSGGTGLRATKRRAGVVGATSTLVGVTSDWWLDSNAWREPGTDTMRYMLGLHRNSGSDYQQTYYEMAVSFDTGGSAVLQTYTAPQAVILPLNASPALTVNQPSQVVRTGTNKFALGLPRVSTPRLASGQFVNLYAVDVHTVEYVSQATLSARPNVGVGVTGPQAAYIPAGVLVQSETGQRVEGHGASALPFAPALALSAGAGLTDGLLYSYKTSVDYPGVRGDVWRGPRSVSVTVTPTAANRQVTITQQLSPIDSPTRRRIVNFWRTLGNGSVHQLLKQISVDGSVGTIGFVDSIPDTQLAQSNFEPIGLPAGLTPAFIHLAFFDGRMFGVERDFPRRVRWSQPTQTGVSPEFPIEFFRDIEDEHGDITGLYALDDKLIAMKDPGVYFSPKGGPALDGTGPFYDFTRLDSEVGHKSGTPAISTGSVVWFFRDGMYSIDRSMHITHYDAIDRWFNMPIIQSAETPLSITYNGKRDEIRLLTTNYRFVFDVANGSWIRDTGGPTGTLLTQHLGDTGDLFIRPNGQVWWDYDIDTGTADASGTIRGVIRSAWVRAAAPEGFFRIYKERALYKIEVTGPQTNWPETTIYFNDDDAILATTTRTGTSGTTKQTIEARNARGKVTSFSLSERLPAGNVTWRLSQWSVLLALKKAMHADSPAALGR